MPVLIDTAEVAAMERFEFWIDASSRIFHPMRAQRPDAAERFSGYVWGERLGMVSVFRLRGDAVAVQRTAAGIRSFDPECLEIAVPLRGVCNVTQDRRSSRVRPGDVVTYDSSRPFAFEAATPFEFLLFHCPRSLFGPGVARFRASTGVPFAGDAGLGRIVADFLVGVVGGLERDGIRHGRDELGQSVVDLVQALHSQRLDVAAARHGAGPARMLAEIKTYIERSLADCALDAAQIARAHYISERYVYRLFEQEGTSLGEWIRARRLDGCQRDLRDPAQSHLTIREIACRRGLATPGYFSRIFRAAYGMSPREYRAAFRIEASREGHSYAEATPPLVP